MAATVQSTGKRAKATLLVLRALLAAGGEATLANLATATSHTRPYLRELLWQLCLVGVVNVDVTDVETVVALNPAYRTLLAELPARHGDSTS